MSFTNPRYDPTRRRRHRHRHAPASHHHSPLTTLATTAAIAYGAYRIGSWAWNAYFGDDENADDDDDGNKKERGLVEHDDDGDDLLYEWTEDYRNIKRDIRKEEGFSPAVDDDESDEDDDEDEDSTSNLNTSSNKKDLHRSRRSRINWSDSDHRSNSPSPPQDYHHHSSNNRSKSTDGMVKQGMKKAASLTATGLGTAVTAGISAGITAFEKSHQPQAQAAVPDQERKLRMGRCRLEASRAMMDFLPTLKKTITALTDVSAETEGLKRLRIKKRDLLALKDGDNESDVETDEIINEEVQSEEDAIKEEERQLWNDIKNKSLTRLVTTIYAHTIVFLVLTVQVNLLGGRLMRDEQEKSGSIDNTMTNDTDRYRSSHQTVLAKTYHYLFTKGIPSLAKSVKEVVEETLQQLDVLAGDEVSLRDVNLWMEIIRNKIEQCQQKQTRDQGIMMSALVKFVIPPEGDEVSYNTEASNGDGNNTEDDELAKYILDETYDLLESPTYSNAERQCLDTTYTQLRTKVFDKLFLTEDNIPLATIVTHFQKSAVSTFHKPPSHKDEMKNWGGVLGMMEEPLPSVPNDYISKLERLDSVLELSDVCF